MSRELDRKTINNISIEKIPDFIFMHLRNMWSVDGLYYLGIEEKYGNEVATEIDRNVWNVMGKIEARRLKKLFNFNGIDLSILLKYLKLSAWVLDLEDKEIREKKDKIIIRNIKCRIQDSRLKKGLREFPCKQVRWGFLKSFAMEINPDIEVICKVCPPDEHTDNIWCEWIFILQK
jgi:hypothetical protein